MSASNALILTLAIDHSSLNEGRVVLKSTLTNDGVESVNFLRWSTPFDSSVNGVFLSIIEQDSNQELVYQGRMMKRSEPILSDYFNLLKNASISNVLDVSKSYNFCPHSRYILNFSGEIIDSNLIALPVKTNNVTFVTGGAFKHCH